MKKVLLICILASILISCIQQKDNSMSFNEASIYEYNPNNYLFTNKWYKQKGDVRLDTLNLYRKEKSLHLTSRKDSAISAVYFFDLSEIEGRTLTVTGKYKVRKSLEAELTFYLKPLKNEDATDSVSITHLNTAKWHDFRLTIPLLTESKEASFWVLGTKEIDLLLSDCEAWIDNDWALSDFITKSYDATLDVEFDQGSGIDLGELTTEKLQNIKVLCRIWGFMKYYHPAVTKGNYNWDYELFRVLPWIAGAKNKDERNELLSKWIDKYGSIKETSSYAIVDSSKYSRFINLDWINDSEIFDEKVILKLNGIKNAKRSQKFNYYLPHYIKQVNNTLAAEREKKYTHISWEDQGFRILTFFRLWNLIEYCFPYTEYMDCAWDAMIDEYIPVFFSPTDQEDYALSIRKLVAEIDDSHGMMVIPYNQLYEMPHYPIRKKNKVPVELIFTADNYIVVKSTESIHFNRGDILLSVNGKEVDKIIEEMSPYIIASNKGGLIRKVLQYLLCTNSDQLQVEIMRKGKKESFVIKDFRKNRQKTNTNWGEIYQLDSKNILHCYGQKNAEEIRDMLLRNMNSKGFIVDLRIGFDNLTLLPELLLSNPPLWLSQNNKSFPGNYQAIAEYNKTPEVIPEPMYKGKIFILVDEYTQSARESWAMWFQTFPNSITIGRQTAGTNGNISQVFLPGNIEFVYTQLGAYYPNWEMLQRKGLKIDIHVSPTRQDITEERDVWIEKVIEAME
ncbi:S41 family peptidase [Bacteroides sp. 519]|uniref:S41 family peptidase n=1 Tax=Bacteroides sp. 519 TaxID=2302937 RepID=UPI0013D245B8|nr:S41 family peptidase [Bacteroides sp. 519]NDV58001.1 hypothetical protein [Bacteroides sp. 519]